jgi:cytochrome c553
VPGLVGLHPIYIVRQLYDIQHGTRTGAAVALMQPVVVSLTIEDMISIAAYTTSRDPGGRDQRPPLVRLSQTLGTR